MRNVVIYPEVKVNVNSKGKESLFGEQKHVGGDTGEENLHVEQRRRRRTLRNIGALRI